MRNHDAEGDATIDMRSLCAGAGIVLIGRGLLTRLLLLKLRRDVKRLNAGDHRPLLRGYADDAVLHFNDGPHRWSGEHRGKAAIERFLRDFVGAGLQGEIRALWIAGPPWALTMVARFDDRAISPPATRSTPTAPSGRPDSLGQDRRARGLLRGHDAHPHAREHAARARHRSRRTVGSVLNRWDGGRPGRGSASWRRSAARACAGSRAAPAR